MGLAWIHAGFSKDPSTQVGAQVVSEYNEPLGSGYNGPPRLIDDDADIWNRPSKKNPDGISKYDLAIHAEDNAIHHSCPNDLSGATLYTTALPCPKCMLLIIKHELKRVVYYDYQSSPNSTLQNSNWRKKSFELARLADIRIEEFNGDLNWVADWTEKLNEIGLFTMD